MTEYRVFGKWRVTTEGDVEGKTVKELGVFAGYIDEIALKLGRQSYYSLRFSIAKEMPHPREFEPVDSVAVSLDIDSDTWQMTSQERANYASKLFANRPVIVRPSNFYASFIIQRAPVTAAEAKEE